MKTHNILASLIAAILTPLLSPSAHGAVSAEEAAKLKSTLTPLGGERAGNKDGTIPAWDGGYTKVSPGHKAGDARPDPFAAEKPLYSINAKNMAQYGDKLSDGVKALMTKYPDYRVDVYATHRTAAAPQWVYDNTFKNATQAKLVDAGQGTEGAYGGIPFPLPKDGYEVIQNHRMAWVGYSMVSSSSAWVVTADGKRSLASAGLQRILRPYYDSKGNLETFKGYYNYGKFYATDPGSKAGESIMEHASVNNQTARGLWQYLVGQRRVRKGPSVAYDTPDAVTSGLGLVDEAFMLFGPLDKHELKLVGKREMYVPYNNNRAAGAKIADLLTPKMLNPSLMRWELHRVWEIEATLSQGKRHVVPKRKYYVDEDTWQIIAFDGWDASGELVRTNYSLTLLAPDLPALVAYSHWGGYDLRTGAYYINMASNELPTQFKAMSPPFTPADFSPDSLANEGAR